ncbi:MAG: hypothetical protein FVQ84_08340 [Planctomycetes bacterium]|nr:hypothetical protein [Planctomycetota bacterium]
MKNNKGSFKNLINLDNKKFKKAKLIYVEWYDAKSCNNGWEYLGEDGHDFDPLLIFSVGWLVGETEAAIVVSDSYCAQTNSIDNPLTIPKDGIKCKQFIRY